jgi:hypothetical protein
MPTTRYGRMWISVVEDSFFLKIQPNKDLDTLIHVSSSDGLRLAQPTARGSAYFGAQPTLTETS